MLLSEYLNGVIDNRGKNPEEYLQKGPFPVLDNYLIKNELYPDIDQVNRYISQQTYSSFLRGYCRKGMVVMTLVGNGIANVTTIQDAKWVVIQNTIGFDVKADKLLDLYLYYFLLYKADEIRQFDRGSGQPSIKKTDLLNMEVNFPDLYTQQKITDLLSCLDKKIYSNKQINNNLEQQAQALITDYASKTPGITPLGALLSFVNGFAFKSGDYLAKGLYKIITIKNVQDGLVDSQGAACMDELPAKLPSDCKLNIGDVLLSLTGNVGRVGIVTENNLLLNQRVAKVKPKNDDLLPFIYFVLRLPVIKTEMENISKGTAQQNLSPIETLKLQLNFDELTAVELSHKLSSMFNQIVYNMIENRNLSEIRNTLLPKLMSGEIDVSKVNISDPSSLDKSLFNCVGE